MRYHTMTSELIRASGEKARLLGHSFVGSVHLLLALLELPGEPQLILRGCGLAPELAIPLAQLLYGSGTPNLPLPQGLTERACEILSLSAREARQRASREILPIHVLAALSRAQDSGAGQLLQISVSARMCCLPIPWNGCNGKVPFPQEEKRRRSLRSCWNSSARI